MALTNRGLAAYARAQAQANSPYWYGCTGQIADMDGKLYEQKKKQYPDQYPPRKWTEDSFRCQFGKKVMDCIGLTKAYINSTSKPDALGIVPEPLAASVYSQKYDWSANGTFEHAKEKGNITTMPEIEGLQVWKNNHVGVYIGNGLVSEEAGHAKGCIISKLSDKQWVAWFKHPAITYYTDIEYFVLRLYVLVLGREPDDGGFRFWVDGLRKKMITPTQVAFSFLTSDEFVSRNLSDDEFLYVLYRALFDREPDAAGKEYWLGFLSIDDDEHTRDVVIVCFLSSEEWKRLVEASYT